MVLGFKLASALITVLLLVLQGGLAAEAATEPPLADATPMSARELYKLYQDKTWLWPNGAGFFAKDGRFTAWSVSGGETAYANGGWWVNFLGGMCIDAAWRTKDGVHIDLTCFNHSKAGNIVYQKREPSGARFVFRSFPRKPDDEFEKLKDGDLVKSKLETTLSPVRE